MASIPPFDCGEVLPAVLPSVVSPHEILSQTAVIQFPDNFGNQRFEDAPGYRFQAVLQAEFIEGLKTLTQRLQP
jgi:hypothetical protein